MGTELQLAPYDQWVSKLLGRLEVDGQAAAITQAVCDRNEMTNGERARIRFFLRRAFVESQAYAPADMTVTLNRLDLEGDCIRSAWTCTSPALPHPMQGHDLWTIRAGKILRLETTLRT
jgi:hypothetical protein